MPKASAAYMDLVWRGYVDEGEEVFHDIVFYANIRYNVDLVAENDRADLNLYITDDDGDVLYRDESEDPNALAWFQPEEDGVYSLFVRAEYGSSDYTLTITEA